MLSFTFRLQPSVCFKIRDSSKGVKSPLLLRFQPFCFVFRLALSPILSFKIKLLFLTSLSILIFLRLALLMRGLTQKQAFPWRFVMITEEGVVEKSSPSKAIVRVERNEACANCQTRGACEMLSKKSMRVEVINDLGAKEGDRVEISVPTGSFLKLSMLVYLLPVVALIIGAYVGTLWAEAKGAEGALLPVIFGALAMGISFLILRRFDRRAHSPSSNFQPRLTKILANGAPLQCDDSR